MRASGPPLAHPSCSIRHTRDKCDMHVCSSNPPSSTGLLPVLHIPVLLPLVYCQAQPTCLAKCPCMGVGCQNLPMTQVKLHDGRASSELKALQITGRFLVCGWPQCRAAQQQLTLTCRDCLLYISCFPQDAITAIGTTMHFAQQHLSRRKKGKKQSQTPTVPRRTWVGAKD